MRMNNNKSIPRNILKETSKSGDFISSLGKKSNYEKQ